MRDIGQERLFVPTSFLGGRLHILVLVLFNFCKKRKKGVGGTLPRWRDSLMNTRIRTPVKTVTHCRFNRIGSRVK